MVPKKKAVQQPQLEVPEGWDVLVCCINPALPEKDAAHGTQTREETEWYCSVPALGISFKPTPMGQPIKGYWDRAEAIQYLHRHMILAVQNPEYISSMKENPQYEDVVPNSGCGKVMPIVVTLPSQYNPRND